MIKLENVEVWGFENAIRGMRNPYNSWLISDSKYENGKYRVGDADRGLMLQLAKAGTEHAKYRRMIMVCVDITAPLYWWKEFDTYKVGTVANSTSTMHTIAKRTFTREDFSCEHLHGGFLDLFDGVITALNEVREAYLHFDEKDLRFFDENIQTKKDVWWQMIQMLPSSYNQKRTIMLNYEVLANIYRQRVGHKLDEWHEFCDWIERLPVAEVIVAKPEKGGKK